MKKILSFVFSIIFSLSIFAGTGESCKSAITVSSKYSAHLEAGTYWLEATIADLPLTIFYAPDFEIDSAPHMICDFRCAGEPYDESLDKAAEILSYSADYKLPFDRKLNLETIDGVKAYSVYIDKEVKDKLLEFGVDDDIPAKIQVTLPQPGFLSAVTNSSNIDGCDLRSIRLYKSDTVHVTSSNIAYYLPVSQWKAKGFQMRWLGASPVKVYVGATCTFSLENAVKSFTLSSSNDFTEAFSSDSLASLISETKTTEWFLRVEGAAGDLLMEKYPFVCKAQDITLSSVLSIGAKEDKVYRVPVADWHNSNVRLSWSGSNGFKLWFASDCDFNADANDEYFIGAFASSKVNEKIQCDIPAAKWRALMNQTDDGYAYMRVVSTKAGSLSLSEYEVTVDCKKTAVDVLSPGEHAKVLSNDYDFYRLPISSWQDYGTDSIRFIWKGSLACTAEIAPSCDFSSPLKKFELNEANHFIACLSPEEIADWKARKDADGLYIRFRSNADGKIYLKTKPNCDLDAEPIKLGAMASASTQSLLSFDLSGWKLGEDGLQFSVLAGEKVTMTVAASCDMGFQIDTLVFTPQNRKVVVLAEDLLPWFANATDGKVYASFESNQSSSFSFSVSRKPNVSCKESTTEIKASQVISLEEKVYRFERATWSYTTDSLCFSWSIADCPCTVYFGASCDMTEVQDSLLVPKNGSGKISYLQAERVMNLSEDSSSMYIRFKNTKSGKMLVSKTPLVQSAPTCSFLFELDSVPKYRSKVLLFSTNSDGKVSYTSSNSAVASVSSDGIVKGLSFGTTKITATVAETPTYSSASVSCTLLVYDGGFLGGETCDEAIPFDWNKAYTQQGDILLWYKVNISNVIDSSRLFSIIVDNLSADYENKANFGIYTKCGGTELVSIPVDLQAAGTERYDVPTSYVKLLSTLETKDIYFASSADDSIRIKIEETGHWVVDTTACDTATLFDWDNGNINPGGPANMYKVDLSFLEGKETKYEIVFKNQSSQYENDIDAFVYLVCEDTALLSVNKTLEVDGEYTVTIPKSYISTLALYNYPPVYILLSSTEDALIFVREVDCTGKAAMLQPGMSISLSPTSKKLYSFPLVDWKSEDIRFTWSATSGGLSCYELDNCTAALTEDGAHRVFRVSSNSGNTLVEKNKWDEYASLTHDDPLYVRFVCESAGKLTIEKIKDALDYVYGESKTLSCANQQGTLLLLSSIAQQVSCYAPSGQLLLTLSLQANAPEILDLPAGSYLIRGTSETLLLVK